MKFSKVSGIYRLHNEQFLPVSLEKAWDFFSNPKNLEEITPKELAFNITSLDSELTYEGQIITYSIQLNSIFRMNWVTEITHLKHQHFFVDEQRFGPYKMWHHMHKFKEVEGGVIMTDIIHYKLPFPILASTVHKLFIQNKLTEIFTFRASHLETFFCPA